MPTTSGHLRKTLALKRKTAETRIAAAGALMKRSSMPDSSEDMQQLFIELSGMTTKLTTSMNALQEIDDAWTTLIDELKDDTVQQKEQDLYETAATDSTSGYLLLIEQCEELKCEVDGFIAATKENLRQRASASQLNQSNPSSPVAGFPNYPAKSSAKLPKLYLPVFDGEDPLSWEPWWTLFEANVHNQPINKVEKFSYLLPLLSKTAAATIKGLSVTESNYDVAVKTLQERFQKPKAVLISVLYGRLKQLPISGKSSNEIRHTYDKCEAICRQLEEAGENLDANTSLSIDLLGKFPEFVIKDLSRYYSIGHSATATDIRQAVRKLVSEVEDISDRLSCIRMANNQLPSNKPKQTDTHWKAENAGKSSALSALDRGTPQIPAQFQSAMGGCYFCDGEHFNSTCPSYRSAQSRLAQLRRRKRCEKCGRANHEAANCRRDVRCIYCRNNSHYTALCPVTFPGDAKPRSVNPSSSKATGATLAAKSNPSKSAVSKTEAKTPSSKTEMPVRESKQANITVLNVGERSSLLTATTTVVNPISGAEQKARLIFDSASHRSYITESLITTLGLESSDEEDLSISVFGTKRSLTISSKIVTVQVVLPNGSRKSLTAHSTPVITESSVLPGGFTEVDSVCLKSMQQMLADDYFDPNGTVDILVGTEYFWDFIIGTKLNTSSGLSLILSSFGLMLAGRYNSCDDHETTCAMFCLTECSPRIPNSIGMVAASSRLTKSRELDVDDYWSLERLGIDDPEVTNDDRALSQFNETIEFKDGRYQMDWPWIEEKKPLLPTNYELSLGRLKSLMKRITTENGELLTKYQEVIQQQLDAGVIEPVPCNEVHRDNTTNHYLPHHPVVKDSSSTTKVRIVNDASARAKRDAVCLNDCIYRGPVILPHLCEVLLRFRCYPIVIVGDVEKAFLQLALRNEARDATRFLWLKDISRAPTPQNIQIYRFCRVPFGVIASPFLLGATIQHHLRTYTNTNHNPGSIPKHWSGLCQSASKVAKDIYVDNITAGATTVEETLCLQRDIVEIFKTAGMNVREFLSNSQEVMNGIDHERRSTQRLAKFLGLQWDSTADVISLSKRELSNDKVTKRTILKQLASIFDPLGLYSPVLLPAKLIFQRLWELNLDWDELIPSEIHSHWLHWQTQIGNLFDHKLPRLTTGSTKSDFASLVVFCDASAKCYATTVYLRSRTERAWTSQLIFCKSRLAPKHKTITLPRLELLAVLIGTRAAQFVTNAINPLFADQIPITIFTDSEIVLSWLQTEKLLERFVRNQVDRIKTLTNVTYHHVNSDYNPADYPTRGLTPSEIVSNQQWWHGPPFLLQPHDEWPITNVRPFNIRTSYRNSDQVSPICHTFVVGRCDDQKIENIFYVDIERFSHHRVG